MPFIDIPASPLLSTARPVTIHYRGFGAGTPLVFLHGGWGYEIYPFDRQIYAFSDRFRVIIPDRTGYGRSMTLSALGPDFHQAAAVETMSVLDALRLERALLWGHSDGAVIALLMGLARPSRFPGLILEATHYFRSKAGSREFFESMMLDADRLGERVCWTLARDHGEDRWRHLMALNGRAWLQIAESALARGPDLYDGRLSQLAARAMFIHGDRDPRTEPGELEAIRRELPGASMHIIDGAGHSPHSERGALDEVNRVADGFLRGLV